MQTPKTTTHTSPLSPAVILGIILSGALTLAVVLATTSGTGSSSMQVTGGNVLLLAPAAFLAGLLSFLSPCTLPILPAYFAFSFQAHKGNIVLMTVAFFMGLATTMTLLGAGASALSALVFQHLRQINLVGGLIIIGFGVMSLMGKGFSGMQRQERPATTVVGSYLYGLTFALGWTACVGPILGTLLTMLATQGMAVVQGAILAFIYALGLGMPLILVATFFSRLGPRSRIGSLLRGKGVILSGGGRALHLHSTSVLSGLLLIGMGVLLASGQLIAITRLASASPLSQWVLSIEEHMRGLFGL